MAFPTLNYNLADPSDLPSALGGQVAQNVHLVKPFAAAQVASGIVTAIARMPAGTRYLSHIVKSSDMDTDGTPALAIDVGIAGIGDTTYDDVDCFLDGSDIGQAGTSTQAMMAAGAGLLVPVEHYITVTAATAADVGAAGTITADFLVVLP